MSKGGLLIYRCRMCGKHIDGVHVPDLWVALIGITSGKAESLRAAWGGPLQGMVSTHMCDDHYIGVTDLVGGKTD